jgi:UDP-N-acetylglucosamine:LPS N-acetylglucosamine transferase
MKRVLILTAGYGEGHNTAARNILRGLEHAGGSRVRAEMHDLFDETYGPFHRFAAKAYIEAINRAPLAWKAIYDLYDRTDLMACSAPTLGALARRLRSLMETFRPDAVCSTYPVYNYLLNRLYPGREARSFRQLTMVTDSISVNSIWTRTGSDLWLVPNADTARAVRNLGAPADKIRVSGFPVQLEFALPETRLEPPPLSEGLRVLYIVNSGKQHAPQVIREILEIPGLHLSVSYGRDERLASEARKLMDPHLPRTRLIGWTKEMPQLMMTHHLVISKAGGATVQEAVAAHCPMIVNQIVPGQEEGNYELLRRNDCGTLASGPADVTRRVREAAAGDGALLRRWRENLRALARPDAALRIASHLLDGAELPRA